MNELTRDVIARAPKVLLHDHLDGGMRPSTVVELAKETGYEGLPTTDVDELAAWVRRGADRNKLELYLETFAHTVGVTQTPESLERAAYEAAEDLAADNVVYAEIRFAPEQHMRRGMDLDAVVEAALRGLKSGTAGTDLTVGLICSAMRQEARSHEIAELAIRHRDEGVVGFDIAGPEAGFPDPPPRCVPALHARELSHHHPRRRGVWTALDPRGAELLRGRAAGSRGSHRR